MDQSVEIPNEESAAREGLLADCTPDEMAERRYRGTLAAMVEDAVSNRRLEMLVDSLASTLGSIGLNCGPRVTGDILGRLGHHLIQADARRRAANEAEQAKKEGRAPH